jgi:hypothetical protein
MNESNEHLQSAKTVSNLLPVSVSRTAAAAVRLDVLFFFVCLLFAPLAQRPSRPCVSSSERWLESSCDRTLLSLLSLLGQRVFNSGREALTACKLRSNLSQLLSPAPDGGAAVPAAQRLNSSVQRGQRINNSKECGIAMQSGQ